MNEIPWKLKQGKLCGKCSSSFPSDSLLDLCPDDGTLLTVATAKEAGTVVADRYRIEHQIAEGGWSLVYKAWQEELHRFVALKVLRSHLSSEPAFIMRFQQEAKAAGSLNHPNLVTLFDFGVLDHDKPFIAMEFIDGMSLDFVLEQQRILPLDRVVNIGLQVCQGLQAAHDKSIIHRDLKPGNIMLSSGQPEYVKILDFGIAKISQADSGISSLTQTGITLGTPGYMSPEQCKGGVTDRRSDIYSLGCILYESLTGTKPFPGQNLYECMHSHLTMDPPSVSSKRPELKGTHIDAVVAKALAKEPGDRYQDASEMIQDLLLISQGKKTGFVARSVGKMPIKLLIGCALGLLCLVPAVFMLFSNQARRQYSAVPSIYAPGKTPASTSAVSAGAGDQTRESTGSSPESQRKIAWMYAHGRGVTQDMEKAAQYYRLAAEQGDCESQLQLGILYFYGKGVPQDYTQAAHWYEKAAAQGNTWALSNLAWCYEHGRGVPFDINKAVNYYRKTALDGNVDGQFHMGWLYYDGRGVPQDDVQCCFWYRKAAEQGNVWAQADLGWMYEKGRGVPQDFRKAVALYRRSAAGGYVQGQLNLGRMYFDGTGVPRNEKLAAYWYEKAAAQGHAADSRDRQDGIGKK